MVKICCIQECEGTANSGLELTYHKFPEDEFHRSKWLKAIGITHSTNSSSVCSLHFLESDYKDVAKKTLKSSCVPSIFNTMESAIEDATDNSNLFDMEVTGLPDYDDEISKKSSINDKLIDGELNNIDTGTKPYDDGSGEDQCNDDANDIDMFSKVNKDKCTSLEITNDALENNENLDEINNKVPEDDNMEVDVDSLKNNNDSTNDSATNGCADSTDPLSCNGEVEEPIDKPESTCNIEEPATPDSINVIPKPDNTENTTEDSLPNDDKENSDNDNKPDTESSHGDKDIKDIEIPLDKKDDNDTETSLGIIEKGLLNKIKEPDENSKEEIPKDKESSSKYNDIEKDAETIECTPSLILDIDESSQKSIENINDKPVDSLGLMGSTSNVEAVECTPELFLETDEDTNDGSEIEESILIDESGKVAEPMFIAIAGENITVTPTPPDSPTDCMMLVENVQVDIDPSTLLMMNDGGEPSDDDDVEVLENKPQEPVSLLTSSDEDDVIIEEPEIDLVEVSDETDEDDMPLTKLVKVKKLSSKKQQLKNVLEKKIRDIFWGRSQEFYCYCCSYTTRNKMELGEHMLTHSAGSQKRHRTILTCPVCNYQSASKAQFSRHKRKHREEKRFECHICDYKARHKMSLVYHLKSHNESEKQQYRCKKCNYKTTEQKLMHTHLKNSHKGNEKKVAKANETVFKCKQCKYTTKRRSDLTRHVGARHKTQDSDDDGTYCPGQNC